MKDSAEGRKIINSYLERNEASLDLDDRRLLVRICVSHMVMLSGKEDLYPSAALKEELAKSIVEAFPCLAIPVDSYNLKNYTHLYNPKLTNGFIDTRLKTMRTTGRSTKRKGDIEDKGKSTNPKKTSCRKPELKENDADTTATYIEDEAKFKVISVIYVVYSLTTCHFLVLYR